MPVIRVDDLSDPRLADFRHVPDPELLRRGAIFVAEGRLVVRTLLTASRFPPRSVLLTETALASLQGAIAPRLARLPVYVVSQATIESLTGYNIHRGCLAIGERPSTSTLDTLIAGASGTAPTLVVLERVSNADNMGGVFRNAAAFGAQAVLLGPGCCDPLYRKAIRVSMGAALRVPFAHTGPWPEALARLEAAGFTVAALTPRREAMSIDAFAQRWHGGGAEDDSPRRDPMRLAVLAGSEGEGLSEEALARADVAVRIPMAEGVDSLNVATATAIALHRLAGGRSVAATDRPVTGH